MEKRLRAEQSQRGEFDRVHACPASTADVPDEREARLVILRPLAEHASRDAKSPAFQEAAKLLSERGTSPRRYRNALVFLAADRTRLAELEQAIRQFLAWRSIEEEHETLNLDAFQSSQAQRKRAEAEEAIKQHIPETYCWLFVPCQEPQGTAVEWQEMRLQGGQGQEGLAVRASRKLKNDGLLLRKLSSYLGYRSSFWVNRASLTRRLDSRTLAHLAAEIDTAAET